MSSSRRTSGEIHILAMLDGKGAGPLSTRFLALPAAFWYGVAGVGVCLLLAVLAWLAHMPSPANDPGIDAESAAIRMAQAADARTSAPVRTADDNAVLVVTTLPHGDELPHPLAGGATIVDVPPPTASAVRAAAVATATAPTPTIASLAAARPASPHTSAALPAASVRGAASHGAGATILAAHTSNANVQRSAAHASPAKPPAARPPIPYRPAAAHAAAIARTDTSPPRSRRQTGTAKATKAPTQAKPAAVDTDVALISAIIQHTVAQGDASDAATVSCADRACGPRMPNRQ